MTGAKNDPSFPSSAPGLSTEARVSPLGVPLENVRLKRAYEDASPHDGLRFLADRLWPRGVSKERAALTGGWLKDLAPSTELREWFGHRAPLWPEFQKRYRTALAAHAPEIERLRALAKKEPLTLVFGACDTQHNEAVVLRDVILGLNAPESSPAESNASETGRRSSSTASAPAVLGKTSQKNSQNEQTQHEQKETPPVADETFKVGDHVRWNSEVGYVTGHIVRIHTSDFDYKGHTHRATPEHPQYEIKSDRTDHIAAHKGSALKLLPE